MFLDVSSTEGGDGMFNIRRNNSTDTTLSVYPDGVKDDDRKKDIMMTGEKVTLTPSSVNYGEGSHSEPGVIASRMYGSQEEQLVVVTSGQEDRNHDDIRGQTCGFIEMDSIQEHTALGEDDEGETAKTEGSYITIPLTPSVGSSTTVDTGKNNTSTLMNFTCTALSDVLNMPGDQPSTTPGPRYGRQQADHADTGREVLSVDREVVNQEPEDEISLSRVVLIPAIGCEAGTEPCLAQDIQTEQSLERGQGDQAVYGCGA